MLKEKGRINKLRITLVLLFVILITVLITRFSNNSQFLKTSSPDGTYILKLIGEKDRPLFFTNEVRFNVEKNNKSFLKNKYLHSADAFDLSFELGYPNYHWFSKNGIQFYNKKEFAKNEKLILIIFNESEEKIKYLRVQSKDKILLFDIQPQSQTKIFVTGDKNDYLWIEVEGENYKGETFGKNLNILKDKKTLTSILFIRIKNGNVIFEQTGNMTKKL